MIESDVMSTVNDIEGCVVTESDDISIFLSQDNYLANPDVDSIAEKISNGMKNERRNIKIKSRTKNIIELNESITDIPGWIIESNRQIKFTRADDGKVYHDEKYGGSSIQEKHNQKYKRLHTNIYMKNNTEKDVYLLITGTKIHPFDGISIVPKLINMNKYPQEILIDMVVSIYDSQTVHVGDPLVSVVPVIQQSNSAVIKKV